MGQWTACFIQTATCVATLFTAAAGPQVRKQTSAFGGKPFVTVWNAPTHDCARYSISLDLDVFDVESSPNEGFYDQKLTIFYKERLGRYPYFEGQRPVNGGVPQNGSLLQHLRQVRVDIDRYIRSHHQEGLAVIDWEEWRPLWIRNWKGKQIYRNRSLALVSERHPRWPQANISRQAQFEFEQSAQSFMVKTLQEGRNARPHSLWGFYLFPDCYNHNYKNTAANYTGRCPDVEISRNDLLVWLWRNSTAIYPSIYLDNSLQSSASAVKFVRSRIREALRVAQLHSANYSLPVFVYSRPTYSYTVQQLTKEHCQKMKNYVEGDFGHYLLNVSTATKYCSQYLCAGHGRCVRRDSEAETYLHLNPDSFQIKKSPDQKAKLHVTGALTHSDKLRLQEDFECQCFRGWSGQRCGTGQSTGPRILPCALSPVFSLVLAMLL